MRGFFLCMAVPIFLSGCASYAPQYFGELRDGGFQPSLPPSAEIDGLPFVPDDDLYCGPAALSMVLTHAGRHAPFDELAPRLFLPGRKGTLQLDMVALARTYGLTPYVIEPKMADLLAEVAAGRPVIVLENFGFSWLPIWHYSTVAGFDLSRKTVLRKSSIRERSVTPMAVFEHLWKGEGYWGFVLLRPGDAPVNPNPEKWFRALAESEPYMGLTDAQSAWEAFVGVFPRFSLGHAALGNVAFNGGRFQEAAEGFRRALAIDPRNAQVAALATTVFEGAKDPAGRACAERVRNGERAWPCGSERD